MRLAILLALLLMAHLVKLARLARPLKPARRRASGILRRDSGCSQTASGHRASSLKLFQQLIVASAELTYDAHGTTQCVPSKTHRVTEKSGSRMFRSRKILLEFIDARLPTTDP